MLLVKGTLWCYNYIMENIFVWDNFFDNADKIRDIALSSRFYSPDELMRNVNWRGFRTRELESYHNELLINSKKYILNKIVDQFNLKDYIIETFFHLTYRDTKNTLENFDKKKWHCDANCRYSGVVYLTPNPPKNSGTSIIFNGITNEIENCFNRMVVYPANYTHAPTDLFGDSIKNGRVTLTFFVK